MKKPGPPKPPWRRHARWLGTLGLLILLAWAARQVPWAATWQAIRRFSPWALAALVGLNALILWLFALRWWWLLRLAGHPVGWTRLTAYRLAAFSVSYFTPGTQFGGEPLQVWALHRREGVPLPTALATVGLDKLIEVLGNFAFLGLGLAVWAGAGLARPAAWGAVAGLVLAVGGYLTAVCQGQGLLGHLTASRWGRLARLAQHGHQAEQAAGRLCAQRRGLALGGLALSLPTWAALVAEYGFLTSGLGLHLNLGEVLVVMTAARLAFLLPLPGGLGALEAGQLLAAQALGYPPAVGMALALIVRMRDLTVGALGLVLAQRYGTQTLLSGPEVQPEN